VRRERDESALSQALQRLENAARAGCGERENLMPFLVDAVRAYATLGEMCNLLRGVYGEYREPALV
jgi:methylmalonyl-CoA mutase N-terminal domain/subunit